MDWITILTTFSFVTGQVKDFKNRCLSRHRQSRHRQTS